MLRLDIKGSNVGCSGIKSRDLRRYQVHFRMRLLIGCGDFNSSKRSINFLQVSACTHTSHLQKKNHSMGNMKIAFQFQYLVYLKPTYSTVCDATICPFAQEKKLEHRFSKNCSPILICARISLALLSIGECQFHMRSNKQD